MNKVIGRFWRRETEKKGYVVFQGIINLGVLGEYEVSIVTNEQKGKDETSKLPDFNIVCLSYIGEEPKNIKCGAMWLKNYVDKTTGKSKKFLSGILQVGLVEYIVSLFHVEEKKNQDSADYILVYSGFTRDINNKADTKSAETVDGVEDEILEGDPF